MNLYYIPFSIEDTFNKFSVDAEHSLTDILKIYTLIQCYGNDRYIDNPIFDSHKDILPELKRTAGKYSNTFCDDTFASNYLSLDYNFKETFWDYFNNYKCYTKISKTAFAKFLNDKVYPYQVLYYKDIVNYYDEEITAFINGNKSIIELMIGNELQERENHSQKIYLPPSLTPSKKIDIIKQYISGEETNPNYLKLISNSRSTAEFPITDDLRYYAAKKYKEYWKRDFDKSLHIEHAVNIAFISMTDKEFDFERKENEFNYRYSQEWIKENLDYPTVLNNFLYLFFFVDTQQRCQFPAFKNQSSTVEAVFSNYGKTDYKTNSVFNFKNMAFSGQMRAYYYELKKNGVLLEKVFEWFFDEYLLKEFNVKGFKYIAPTENSTFLEKCILLACSVDSILKQFSTYCFNKEIDHELFEISSNPAIMSEIPSMISKKYVYPANYEIFKEMFLLYSDQSLLTYTEKTKGKYDELPKMLLNEDIVFTDYNDHQLEEINWLINRGALFLDHTGHIKPNTTRILLLKNFYHSEVYCYSYAQSTKDLIKELEERKEIDIESTLFSRPEQEYLSYMLNNSKYGNGPALRNNYVHGTYSLSESKHEEDYMELLKIMVLIIIKINEEFCLMFPES